jgi:hypothetical protein
MAASTYTWAGCLCGSASCLGVRCPSDTLWPSSQLVVSFRGKSHAKTRKFLRAQRGVATNHVKSWGLNLDAVMHSVCARNMIFLCLVLVGK